MLRHAALMSMVTLPESPWVLALTLSVFCGCPGGSHVPELLQAPPATVIVLVPMSVPRRPLETTLHPTLGVNRQAQRQVLDHRGSRAGEIGSRWSGGVGRRTVIRYGREGNPGSRPPVSLAARGPQGVR